MCILLFASSMLGAILRRPGPNGTCSKGRNDLGVKRDHERCNRREHKCPDFRRRHIQFRQGCLLSSVYTRNWLEKVLHRATKSWSSHYTTQGISKRFGVGANNRFALNKIRLRIAQRRAVQEGCRLASRAYAWGIGPVHLAYHIEDWAPRNTDQSCEACPVRLDLPSVPSAHTAASS